MAANLESDSEVERAMALLVEREGDLGEPRERQRALGLLARRGFSSEDAYEAIRRARRAREGLPPAPGAVTSDGVPSR